MQTYLFRYNNEGFNENAIVNKILTKYNFKCLQFLRGNHETSDMMIQIPDVTTFYISEFPGNCSALILNDIQKIINRRNDILKSTVDFAVEICKELDYSCLFVTTTEINLRDYLMKDYQFVVTSEFVNAHSERLNYFMQKFF